MAPERPHILFVSQNQDAAEIYSYFLEEAGFSVDTFRELPTDQVYANAVVIQLHPTEDAGQLAGALDRVTGGAPIVALVSVESQTGATGMSAALLLPVFPYALVQTLIALLNAAP